MDMVCFSTLLFVTVPQVILYYLLKRTEISRGKYSVVTTIVLEAALFLLILSFYFEPGREIMGGVRIGLLAILPGSIGVFIGAYLIYPWLRQRITTR
jgi:hypothetical protein